MLTSNAPAHAARPALATDAQARIWDEARAAWLGSKQAKSGSFHTVRAYAQDFADFFAFAGKEPWLVTHRDAAAWLAHLTESGKAPATVNRKLASLSSFYAFVSTDLEPLLLVDAHGDPRPNPFQRPERMPVTPYAGAHPLTADALRACLRRINRKTRTGARDYALITAYVFTGRRSAEIAGLRWMDLEHDASRVRCYYTWRGKNGFQRTDELPMPVWHAICAYLRMTDRLDTIRADDFIFRAIFSERAARLPNVLPGDPNRPLSSPMILRIVKRRFAAAGVDPARIGTHTLRHTAAALRYRDGKGQDVTELSALLNHSSIAVTQSYLASQPKPVDGGWTAVEQALSLS